MLEGLLGAAATAVLGGAGWLIKRWLERRSPAARIEEARSLTMLHREMQESGATLEMIEHLKDSLLQRRKNQEKYEGEILEFMRQDFRTQTEMNIHAGYLLDLAQVKLRHAAAEYASMLDADRSSLFEATQNAWEVFVEAQARFAASIVDGGTMYSLVYAGEKEELTIQRAASVRSAFEAEREL